MQESEFISATCPAVTREFVPERACAAQAVRLGQRDRALIRIFV